MNYEVSDIPCEYLKHHARVNGISAVVKKSLTILKDFFHDGYCTVHVRFEPWRDASFEESTTQLNYTARLTIGLKKKMPNLQNATTALKGYGIAVTKIIAFKTALKARELLQKI